MIDEQIETFDERGKDLEAQELTDSAKKNIPNALKF